MTIFQQMIMVEVYPSPTPEQLSPRELEVLKALVHGKSYKQIACMLQIRIKTVQFYAIRARLKLHASTREEAAIKAILLGVIPLE